VPFTVSLAPFSLQYAFTVAQLILTPFYYFKTFKVFSVLSSSFIYSIKQVIY